MGSRLRQLFSRPESRPIVIKTFIYIGLFGLTFYGAFSMARSFASTHKEKVGKDRELADIQERLRIIGSESNTDDTFQREKILREKLHMVKPGEDLIIIVPDDVNTSEEN